MHGDPALPGRPAANVVRAAELRVWHDAAAMLADTKQQAADMHAASAAAFEAERRRGYDEGLERGAAEIAERVTATAAAADALLQQIERALPGLVCDAVGNLLGAFDLGDLLRPAIRHALGRLRLNAAVTIRVAPDGVAAVRAACDAPGGASGLHVQADPGLAPGRCLLESELGTVDLGIEAQLSILRSALAAAWEQAA